METTTEDTKRLGTILERIATLGTQLHQTFTCEVGPKFIRVVTTAHGGRSVHTFVDHSTGDIIKAAGWKAPAKDKGGLAVRGNLLNAEDFARLLDVCDPYGSYLYKGAGQRTAEVVEARRITRERYAEHLAKMAEYAAQREARELVTQ